MAETRGNIPDDQAFSYRAHKDGKVRIALRGRVVTTLAGNEAALSEPDRCG